MKWGLVCVFLQAITIFIKVLYLYGTALYYFNNKLIFFFLYIRKKNHKIIFGVFILYTEYVKVGNGLKKGVVIERQAELI